MLENDVAVRGSLIESHDADFAAEGEKGGKGLNFTALIDSDRRDSGVSGSLAKLDLSKVIQQQPVRSTLATGYGATEDPWFTGRDVAAVIGALYRGKEKGCQADHSRAHAAYEERGLSKLWHDEPTYQAPEGVSMTNIAVHFASEPTLANPVVKAIQDLVDAGLVEVERVVIKDWERGREVIAGWENRYKLSASGLRRVKFHPDNTLEAAKTKKAGARKQINEAFSRHVEQRLGASFPTGRGESISAREIMKTLVELDATYRIVSFATVMDALPNMERRQVAFALEALSRSGLVLKHGLTVWPEARTKKMV